MKNFDVRFRYQISQGMRIERALDIGSYRGEFTKLLRRLWPEAVIWQFEADERQRRHNPAARYALLGDSQRDVDFYTIRETATTFTTGSSIYRENTEHYRNPIIVKKRMTTIDKLMETINFSGNWKDHGLVKLDTQGSELDILEGAKNFLEVFTPRFVLLEVSIFPYNDGGPLIADVVTYMSKILYRPIDVFDMQYAPDARLNQMDFLFTRTDT